ncbi:type I secretion protein [Chelativorans sp. YIM 93263]|uniref:type I secretion protein n=1 Tax=Chelativorans sp. YIM 93263 TaxID=2906648 RepID=UPI002378F3F6|nr:type I secretion protein [Chelativorans sp. YIM 93263]
MALDKITEAIAHFIGVFETITDATRMREAYESFDASRRKDDDAQQPDEEQEKPREEYALRDFTPVLEYTPPPVPPEELKAESNVIHDPIPVELNGADTPEPTAKTLTSALPRETAGFAPFELPPHGSYAAFIKQNAFLNDNDYLSLGGSGLAMVKPPFETGPELLAMLQEAESVSPFSAIESPATQDSIADTVMDAWHAIAEAAEAPPQDGVTVYAGPVLSGHFVNGLEVTDAPKLSDYRPDQEEIASPSRGPQPGKGNGLIEPKVEFEGGGNELVNEAILGNDWMTGRVIAGMGDSYEINAIVQTNAWWDQDLVSTQTGAWTEISSPTQAFNIANIERIDASSSVGGEPAPASGQFPQHWAVSRVEGDLVLLNWIEQFNFMADNDTAVLASSGVKSTILAGGNTQVNGVSVADLGLYYDLIVVGGNIYDSNIIQQTNVLFDNDLIGTVEGFQTTGNGTFGTTGNLLWNQAQITNVGAHDRFEAMPAGYRATGESFASGSMHIDNDVLKDSAFQDLPYLRVLFVGGDLLDVQFIKQTNVLGDADQIALAMNALAPRMDANWSVMTGGNALLNFAGIHDVDAAGKTYLAGNHYSQELLVQAEFISSDPSLAGQDADALINEAVAFLDDEMLTDRPTEAPTGDIHINDGTHPDVMQTMLA